MSTMCDWAAFDETVPENDQSARAAEATQIAITTTTVAAIAASVHDVAHNG